MLLPFAADDVGDPSRGAIVAEELEDAREILIDALTRPALPVQLPEVPTTRKVRPLEEQHTRPLNKSTAVTRVDPEESHCTWLCAFGVLVDGPHVHSRAPAWASGRSMLDSADEGDCASVSARIHDGRTVRVGWVLSQARAVGVDQWGLGYGGTGRKVHNNDYQSYGRKFGVGDVVTSKLDRTGDLAILTFYVNGERVAEDPAFQISRDEFSGTAFFAVFGTPGFHVEMLQDGGTCPQTLDGRAEVARALQDRSVSAAHDRITVLSFNRHPREFEDMLLSSSFARQKKDEGIDVQPLWAHGAKIFVSDLTSSDLEECRIDPDVRHVVVRDEDEAEIHAILEAIPYKRRPRLKPGVPRVVIPGSSNLSRFHGSSSNHSSLPSKSYDSAKYPSGSGPQAHLVAEHAPAGSSSTKIVVKHTFIDIGDDMPLDTRSTKSI